MLRRILPGIAVLVLLAPMASAQTADEVIAKNIKAKGGMEKIKSCQSMRVHGRMVMGQGMEAPFTMMQKRPKMSRTEFTIQGMTGMQVYDGKNAWAVMPFMGKKDPEIMPAEQAEMMDEQSDMDGPLVDYKEKGNTVELLGKEQVEGADAYKLKVTLKNGQIRTLYLDAETGLEVKSEAKRTIRGTEVESETLFGDYKEVQGMMMPFTMESGAKGSPMRQKMVMDSVEVNPVLPDTLFALPAGAKRAAPPVVAGTDSAKAVAKPVAPKSPADAKQAPKAKKP